MTYSFNVNTGCLELRNVKYITCLHDEIIAFCDYELKSKDLSIVEKNNEDKSFKNSKVSIKRTKVGSEFVLLKEDDKTYKVVVKRCKVIVVRLVQQIVLEE